MYGLHMGVAFSGALYLSNERMEASISLSGFLKIGSLERKYEIVLEELQ